MNKLLQYILFIVLLFCSEYVYGIAIKITGQAFIGYLEDLYSVITKEFNEYSTKNNLDIQLNLELFSKENTTIEWDSFDSTIHNYLKKKSPKYDIIIYDPLFTRRFSHYFVDLNDWIPEEHLNQYFGDSAKLGKYKNQWVGLPLLLKYTILYSNTALLEKYNKSIPTTWDEFLTTGKYILEKENNKNLVGYNGYFPKGESLMCTIYGFLYSSRDNITSPFPELTSKSVEEGLNTLLKFKNELSSDEVYSSDEEYNYLMLYNQNILFSSFWDIDHNITNYKMSPFPGRIKGVNGSCVGGYLMGINKYIDDEKKRAAAEVITFFTSEYIQKEIILKKYQSFSGLFKLYDDKKVCTFTYCELIKSLQSIERPSSIINNYESYSNRFTSLVSDFLYHGKSTSSTMKELDDIIKIHYYSIKESYLSLIVFILFMLLTLSIIIIYILILRFKDSLTFFTLDLWTLYTLGNIMIAISGLTHFGKSSSLKCYFNHVLLLFGLGLTFIPLLFRLITNFPVLNKYSHWIENHKIIFIISLISTEILFNSLILLSPYQIEEVVLIYNKNYYHCKMEKKYKTLILFFQISPKVVVYFLINALIYLEWNIQKTFNDIKAFALIMIINGISYVLFIIYHSVTINDFLISYSIYLCLIAETCFINYILLVIVRILQEKYNFMNIRSIMNKSETSSQGSSVEYGGKNTFNSDLKSNNLYDSHDEDEYFTEKKKSIFKLIIQCHNSRSQQ